MTRASTQHGHQRAQAVSPSVGINEHGRRGLKVLATGVAPLLGCLRRGWVVYAVVGLSTLLLGRLCRCRVVLHRCRVVYTVVGSSHHRWNLRCIVAGFVTSSWGFQRQRWGSCLVAGLATSFLCCQSPGEFATSLLSFPRQRFVVFSAPS